MKKTTIRSRLLRVFLEITLGALFLVGILLAASMLYTMSGMNRTIDRLLIDYNRRINSVIKEKGRHTLQLIADEQAYIASALLGSIEQQVSLLTELFPVSGAQSAALAKAVKSTARGNAFIDNAYLGTENGLYILFPEKNRADLPAAYDPRTRPWYIKAKNASTVVWSEVYPDTTDESLLLVTCSKAVRNDSGRVTAVAGADVPVALMNEKIIKTSMEETGYSFVMDRQGHLITRPENVLPEDKQYDELLRTPIGASLLDNSDRGLKEIAGQMIRQQKGIFFWKRQAADRDKLIAFSSIGNTNWKLGVMINVQDLTEESTAELALINRQTIKAINGILKGEVMILVIGLLIILLLIVLPVILIAARLSQTITQPIRELAFAANEIGNGNFQYQLTIESRDELQLLADTFNEMAVKLQNYVKMEAELSVASKIQLDMLPKIFPPYPHRQEIDIYASMHAAKKVGGDFYDFFFVQDDIFCFLVADVSGKGVPASLFMVISKTLIKTEALRSSSPHEVLTRVNNLLAEENDEYMFLTVFIALLDIKTGVLQFANGGHNPPLLAKKQQPFEYLKVNQSKVLGIFKDFQYQSQTLTLQPGDKLYLYSDGVTEAMDPRSELFSEERLESVLNELKGKNAREIEAGVQNAVKVFVRQAEQSDDITMLIIEYQGKPPE